MDADRTARGRTTTGARTAPIGLGPSGEVGGLAPSQWLGLVVAAVFVIVGIAGFVKTGVDDFAAHDTGITLLGFEVNPLHNVVHLALGIVGLLLVWSRRGALAYGIVVAVGYAGALVYGLIAIGKDWDVLSINAADNWLHLALALVGVVLALLAARDLAVVRRSSAGADIDLRTGTGTGAGTTTRPVGSRR